MKIANLETYVVANPVPYKGAAHWEFLKLETDDGIKGFGEAGIYDPIDQGMTAGLKLYYTAILMDTNRLVRTAAGSTYVGLVGP